MKKLNLLFVMLLLTTTSILAQVPDAINFQAIARNTGGDVMPNTNIQIRLTVLDGSATGIEVYQELRALTTNNYGSFSFQIGRDANFTTIGAFEDIIWETSNKFLKIDYDPTNTFNWNLTLGTIEFVSVPYAFATGAVSYIDLTGVQDGDVLIYNTATEKFEPRQVTAETIPWSNITGTPPDVSTFNNDANYLTSFTEVDGSITNEIQNLSQVLAQSNDGDEMQIKNIANPTDTQDAATKAYVDAIKNEIYAEIGVTDIDNNHYDAVLIGNQVWMAENLKTTHYADGTEIPTVVDANANGTDDEWAALTDNNTDDAYCYYNNNTSGEATVYGALYTWAAAMGDNAVSSATNPSGVQGVCPTAWHLPSDAEWIELTTHLGGFSVAGGKMKETGTTYWNTPNTGATNSSSFSALPGGYRYYYDGTFNDVGYSCSWWSSTEYNGTYACHCYLYYDAVEAHRNYYNKLGGLSVRCVRD